MIVQFFKPDTVADALALKKEYGTKAAYLGGGSKLNSASTRCHETIAISLAHLGIDRIVRQGNQLEIGATVSLQALIDHKDVPGSLKQMAKLVYSRHLRNQATVGGEIAACQKESLLLPLLLVLQAQLILDNGTSISLETYLSGKREGLIQKIVIADAFIPAATRKISQTVDGLTTLTVAVALPASKKALIALEGVAEHAIRLTQVESLSLEGAALEKAVSDAIKPKGDLLRGSAEYKRYIAGVVVADLLTDCQQQGRK